jgi:hypothetical protein
MISLPTALLFFASEAFMMEYWDKNYEVSNRVLGAGIIAFCNDIVYVIDLALVFLISGGMTNKD